MSATLEAASPLARGRPLGGLRFDWTIVVFTGWTLAGVYLDGWAHLHVPQLESFFTTWHAVLYSGFLAAAAFLLGSLLRNRAKGHPWAEALPDGYQLSLWGALIFAAAGVGDMFWHLVFGVESDFEALFSPTHLGLGLGAALIGTGPLRAGWRRSEVDADPRSWATQLPIILSLTFLLSAFTFFTQDAHPFGLTWPAEALRPSRTNVRLLGYHSSTEEIFQLLGAFGIILQSGILMAVVLLALRRWPLRPGSLTVLFTFNTSLMAFMRDIFLSTSPYVLVLVAILGGIAADLLLWWLGPAAERPGRLRFFAFLVPTILYTLYFLALMLTGGIWWSVPMWTGSVVYAGIVGWLLSYLLVPPRPLSRWPAHPGWIPNREA
jgi:hypothetical protein